MAQSQLISNQGSKDVSENARYLGGALNQNSYMDDTGLAHDDSLLTGLKDEYLSPSGLVLQPHAGSKASPRTSGNFQTIQPVTEREINSASLFDADPKLPVSRKLAALDQSFDPRNLRPSQRNKVILTRSVDLKDSRSHVFGQNASVSGQPGVVTARMHLNRNTTLELIDSVSKQQKSQWMHQSGVSPFSVSKAAQQRKKFVEERG